MNAQEKDKLLSVIVICVTITVLGTMAVYKGMEGVKERDEQIWFLTHEVETQRDQIRFLMYKECLSERTDYYHWRTMRNNKLRIHWKEPTEGECRYAEPIPGDTVD